ncbi:MAG: hypothetical protein JEZ12_25905 [Desulfobacterium sp.]|nr:hypothetical protein [Desulfobacterium sp.]
MIYIPPHFRYEWDRSWPGRSLTFVEIPHPGRGDLHPHDNHLEDTLTHSKKESQEIPVDDLYSFINDFPALLWRIEIARARIEFLNGNTDVAPGVDGTLLLKNMEYRNKVLLPEDRHMLETFMEAVKEGKNAATIFRVKTKGAAISWLKLTGTINLKDPRYYYGYLLNADDTVAVIKGVLGRDLELKLMIEDADNPVLLVEYDGQRVICANPGAKELFGLTEADFRNLPFQELHCHPLKHPLAPMLKELPLSRKWMGKLEYLSTDGKNVITAETVVRYLVHKERRLIRFSLQNPQVSQAPDPSVSASSAQDMEALVRSLTPLHDMNEIMETCLANPMVSAQCDGILFSDVHVRRNMVTVYGAGVPFPGSKQDDTFSYKGTIAEDINRYALDHLVVDDTQDSIKPIDWALFVPRGIRSYFAMPFYSRRVLRTVLVLCATTPGHFEGRTTDDFLPLFQTINTAIRAWRRHHRR